MIFETFELKPQENSNGNQSQYNKKIHLYSIHMSKFKQQYLVMIQ